MKTTFLKLTTTDYNKAGNDLEEVPVWVRADSIIRILPTGRGTRVFQISEAYSIYVKESHQEIMEKLAYLLG